MPSQFWSIGYITFSRRMHDSCGKLFASTGHTLSSIFIKTLTRGVVTKTRNGTRNGKEQGMEWNNKWNGLFFSNMEWNEKLNVEWNGTDVGWYASTSNNILMCSGLYLSKVLTFQFNCYCSHTKNSSTHFNYYKGDYEAMRQELNINWEEELCNDEVNNMLKKLNDRISSAKEKFIPRSRPFPRKGTVPLCKNTVDAIKRKHRTWTRFIESRDDNSYKLYAKARNKVKWLVKKEKREREKRNCTDLKIKP